MTNFATYLHPETCLLSKPADQIGFMGHSVPYFTKVQRGLTEALAEYPQLPVNKADFDLFETVHTAEYLDKIRLMAAEKLPEDLPKLSIECHGYEFALPGYLYGLGGLMSAVDTIKQGTFDRVYTFSLGGHHAYPDSGHGYCLLNPTAAMVRYAQSQGFEKIAIVDWDIHHGDGTQTIFANDDSVYCISIHSMLDLYMSKMVGLKLGTTTMGDTVGHCNIPLVHSLYDDEFMAGIDVSGNFYRADNSLVVFEEALYNLPWEPDLVIIFSGYDSHQDDGGANITNWSNDDFQTLTRLVLDRAEQCDSPVISTHGGGYTLSVTISAAVSHVEILAQ